MISRRGLIPNLGLLGLAGAGALVLRERVFPPAPRVVFAEGLTRTDWIDLPRRGGLLEVPARVGGVPIRAVIDSGAQFSAIDRGLAERLALPKATALPLLAFGVSGGPSLTHTVGLDLHMGQLRVGGVRAAVLEIGSLSAVTGRDFQLLVGRDVLRELVVLADFPRRRVALQAREAFAPDPAAFAVPLRLAGGAPMTTVQVEDAPALEVMIDTGATGVLALSREAAQAAGLLDGRPRTQARSVSLGGVSLDALVTASQVRFAGRELADVQVQIYAPSVRGPIPQGLLGVGALETFEMALDLRGGRLFLTPGARGR
ncbi:aspartyl protease family protein [Phenylobacterium sp.]|uniref:aspartyl protease family protein n=1 Tax=Phenylobacterium sp. TaxID=1871053 RepID=UPI0039839A1E